MINMSFNWYQAIGGIFSPQLSRQADKGRYFGLSMLLETLKML